MNYYNEIEPYCAQWLKNLIAAGLIPAGDVDDRDIKSVRTADLAGYAQCHFFAGLGGWSRALALAGWPVDRGVWTGSCPCQPFSHAGQRKGFDDKRHLWPAWCDLIRQCRPAIVLGEQVASAKLWLDAVCADLEGSGYAFGAAILPAAGVGAPHQRDRIWFVADTTSKPEREPRSFASSEPSRRSAWEVFNNSSPHAPLANGQGEHAFPLHAEMGAAQEPVADAGCEHGGSRRTEPGTYQPRENIHAQRRNTDVADASGEGLALRQGTENGRGAVWYEGDAAPAGGWWLVEPDVGRVAHGIPARVAKLRALGNAIVPQVAAEFIGAYLDVAP